MEGPIGVGEDVMSTAGDDEDIHPFVLTAEMENNEETLEAVGNTSAKSTKDGITSAKSTKEGITSTKEDPTSDEIIVVAANDEDPQAILHFSVVSTTQSKQTNYYTEEEIEDQEKIFYKLYDKLPMKHGAFTSTMNRDRLGLATTTLAYAEVSLDVLRDIYNLMYQNCFSKEFGGKLYCIGAGMGKSTMAQLLLHDYISVHGIEILSDLYVICEDVRRQFNEFKNDYCSQKKIECGLRFTNGDAMSMDWHDADVTYLPATSFDSGMMKKIKSMVQKMKTGAIVILLSKELKSSLYELIVSKEIEISFGMTKVYLYRRNDKPHSSYLDDVEFLDSLGIFKR